ncbi:DUF3813 domain-containing protein [Metabacillus fastidiosus]|uniref:DUF3813 domain-containing protein n=1 Tax=Metabacillus fastidiosus TaxID=1458 RepID=UPI002E1C0645|nr:DUF3813 domain-containing protein [Metabacillus fastidiosus]
MGNRLFQEAREYVLNAEQIANGTLDGNKDDAITKAKNALVSAYANTTEAEKQQLRELQSTIDSIS